MIQQYEDIEEYTPGAGDPALKQYLVEEFVEDYQDGRLNRRDALKRIAGLTGSLIVANSILAACAPPPTPAATGAPTSAPATLAATVAPTAATSPSGATGITVPPNDPAIQSASVQFPGQGATVLGYLARPAGDSPSPIVLVCHENRGLVEHTQDVARRLAKAGFAALAVDLLSRQGGTDKVSDPAQIPGLLGNMAADQMVGDFQAGLAYLQSQPFARRDRAGMTGFCFGGGITWRAATRMPDLRAAVPFYGPNPPLEEVPNIRAAVLAFYGEKDTRITQGSDAIQAAMKQNNKVFERVIYPNADHAFFNDTGPRYNPDAARDAWSRLLAWFDRYLRA